MAKPLIAIRQLRYADLLASYLTSQHIDVSVVHDAAQDQYIVQLNNEADFDKALSICQAFVQSPNDPKYQQAAWQHSERTDIKSPSKPNLDVKRWLIWLRRAPFCGAILFTCTLVFLLSLVGLFQPIAEQLMIQPLGQLLDNNQWWRLLGPALIHFSMVHFVFNLLWWCMLGGRIEHKLGTSFLILLFVITAVVSNVAQLIAAGPNFGGLSGVVYGVLGFVWFIGWLRPSWGIDLPKPVIGFMLLWLILGYADILWVNMANAAHTAGLVSGCAIAWFLHLGAGSKGRHRE